MNKKSMAKLGIILILLAVVIFIFIIPLFSSALLDNDLYILGEKIRFNFRNYLQHFESGGVY